MLDLEQALLAEPWPVASWQEVVERAVPDLARGDAGRIRLDLVESGLAGAATLEAALAALDTEPGGLARATGADEVEVDQVRENLRLALAAGGLVALPGATPVVDWTQGVAWLLPDGTQVGPRDLVDPPAAGATVTGAEVAQRLGALGVDLTTATDPALLPAPPEDLWELWTLMRDEDGGRVTLAIYSTGILALPQEFSRKASRRGDYTRAAQVEACEKTFAASTEHLRRTPGAVWFPADEIADAKLRIFPLRATVILTDGSRHRFRGDIDHSELVDLVEGLGLGSYGEKLRTEARI